MDEPCLVSMVICGFSREYGVDMMRRETTERNIGAESFTEQSKHAERPFTLQRNSQFGVLW